MPIGIVKINFDGFYYLKFNKKNKSTLSTILHLEFVKLFLSTQLTYCIKNFSESLLEKAVSRKNRPKPNKQC